MTGYAVTDFGVKVGAEVGTDDGVEARGKSGRKEGQPKAHGCLSRILEPEGIYDLNCWPSAASPDLTSIRNWADWIFG